MDAIKDLVIEILSEYIEGGCYTEDKEYRVFIDKVISWAREH